MQQSAFVIHGWHPPPVARPAVIGSGGSSCAPTKPARRTGNPSDPHHRRARHDPAAPETEGEPGRAFGDTPRKAQARQTRDAIVTAARRLFSDASHDGVSLQDIAAAAGISQEPAV
ncbi:TetR family transcriptional regulator [Brevundimonas sp. AAP58]|uniref:TetR family transcriptional regulator n=1 Tax=Brevundimonas sp. AAP58 TaxID=1523422 RepID=UPI0018D018D5